MKFEHSELFIAVQRSNLFKDCKTFADAIPKVSWQHAIEAFEHQKPTDLQQFVENHFGFPQSPELEELPQFSTVKDYISELWTRLERPQRTQGEGSLLPLPHPYIVPGGRFNEIYYWDSYFTALGLMDAGRSELVAAMLDNFIALINTFGHVPNGNRSYYLSRSQPPVTALMVQLLWPVYSQDKTWLDKVTKALVSEYQFWMNGSQEVSELRPAVNRVVRMPSGTLLNRYWDDETTPRPESFREDMELASGLPDEQKAEFFREVRAACESGWDFSSRWFDDEHSLSTIATTKRVPVDLNGLLYMLEKQISHCLNALHRDAEAIHFDELAIQRANALQEFCWDAEQKWFMDFDFKNTRRTPVLSLAAVVMLFTEIADETQAHDMSLRIERDFLKQGGLVTTLNRTHEQWDSPNGWAPLQWFAVSGLVRFGKVPLARIVMHRWLSMIELDFKRHGCLLEKYNVCELGIRASGGEYLVQQGFGWTNGVTQRFYRLSESASDTWLDKL